MKNFFQALKIVKNPEPSEADHLFSLKTLALQAGLPGIFKILQS